MVFPCRHHVVFGQPLRDGALQREKARGCDAARRFVFLGGLGSHRLECVRHRGLNQDQTFLSPTFLLRHAS